MPGKSSGKWLYANHECGHVFKYFCGHWSCFQVLMCSLIMCSSIHIFTIVHCSCVHVQVLMEAWHPDFTVSCASISSFALVFDLTHSGRRSTLTCRGLAFFSARLPPPSGEIRIRGKSKHLKGRLGPRVSNVTFFNCGGRLGPYVSNVTFFNHGGQLGPRVSDVTFFNHGGRLGPRVSDVTFFEVVVDFTRMDGKKF